LPYAKFSPNAVVGTIEEYEKVLRPSLSGKSIVEKIETNSRPFSFVGDSLIRKHGSPQILESVNPTGNVFTKYTPELRANALLGKNITTLDKTMKAHPDEFITIYRGAPKNQLQINAGDFVTDNLQLAKDYAGTGHVIKKQVKLKDVLDDITEPLGSEYIYKPSK
jgi:hypothetical protein